MALLGTCILLFLLLGVILFFIIGIFFLKKEWEWSRFEKARELWDLSLEVINYVKEQKPAITPSELKEEVKKIMAGLNLSFQEEFLELLIKEKEQEKAVE